MMISCVIDHMMISCVIDHMMIGRSFPCILKEAFEGGSVEAP